ncbi:hypothetical protein BDF22DRAFT_683290 [Syncephalis plumigaleata]|nr:hypothetical protein BDF22DRAFT_683290 [Syncephalis plumigaleata]
MLHLFYSAIILAYLSISLVVAECLVPEWKTTCQRMCLDSQHWDIKYNRCYSSNPNDLICTCGNADFTQELKVKFGIHHNKHNDPIQTEVQSTIATNPIASPASNTNEYNASMAATTMLPLKTNEAMKGDQHTTPCQQDTFKCDGHRIGICNFNQFVWTTCPIGTICRLQGNTYYCGY